MAVIQEYKCPNCGGVLEFDSSIQKMKCPYCDSEFNVEDLKKYDEELNQEEQSDDKTWETQPGCEWSDGETDNMRVYVCKSCGGEIIADENTAATHCPYCDNPVVMMGNLKGSLKPDFVIPFKLDKKAAKNALTNHLKGKRLLPKVFKDENHIDEIKGIYVPFWLFDADVNADISYSATKVRHWSDSRYEYTETSYFDVQRAGNISFTHIPIDGSSTMPDDLMESIEPYSFSDAVDFQTAYLSGYFADKYDVNAQQSIDRANRRVDQSTIDSFKRTVNGYDMITTKGKSVRISNGKAKYALYPVWILNTTWNNKKYQFAMNGQTGKFAGDLPLDKSAYNKWLFGLIAAFSVATFLILYLLWMFF